MMWQADVQLTWNEVINEQIDEQTLTKVLNKMSFNFSKWYAF